MGKEVKKSVRNGIIFSFYSVNIFTVCVPHSHSPYTGLALNLTHSTVTGPDGISKDISLMAKTTTTTSRSEGPYVAKDLVA